MQHHWTMASPHICHTKAYLHEQEQRQTQTYNEEHETTSIRAPNHTHLLGDPLHQGAIIWMKCKALVLQLTPCKPISSIPRMTKRGKAIQYPMLTRKKKALPPLQFLPVNGNHLLSWRNNTGRTRYLTKRDPTERYSMSQPTTPPPKKWSRSPAQVSCHFTFQSDLKGAGFIPGKQGLALSLIYTASRTSGGTVSTSPPMQTLLLIPGEQCTISGYNIHGLPRSGNTHHSWRCQIKRQEASLLHSRWEWRRRVPRRSLQVLLVRKTQMKMGHANPAPKELQQGEARSSLGDLEGTVEQSSPPQFRRPLHPPPPGCSLTYFSAGGAPIRRPGEGG